MMFNQSNREAGPSNKRPASYSMEGVSEAFYEAVCAVGRAVGVKPLPNGLNTAEIGDWTVNLNTSDEPVKSREGHDVQPYEVQAANNQYLAFASFGPAGGMIGGYTEQQFIDDMRSFKPEDA